MRINRAYINAGTMGKQSLGSPGSPAAPTSGGKTARQGVSQGGDTLNLSAEALALLSGNDNGSMSSGPDDGTYDQFGNMTRQFDTVQTELRRLAAQMKGNEAEGKINGIRHQLSTIRATV